MSAPFRVSASMIGSPRLVVVGQVAGYTADEALGRWVRAGSECTERQSYILPELMVVALFGPRGVDALLAAELAQRADGGGIRMLEMDGEIEWYGDIASKRRRAGKARVAGAVRDDRGRLLPSSTTSTSPARAGVLDQQVPSASPTLASAPTPTPTPTSEIHTRERPARAGLIARDVWAHGLKAANALIAAKIKVPAWTLMPDASSPAWIALLDRVCELLVSESTPEAAQAVALNRIDVAAAKVRAEPAEPHWFTASAMFTRNSFETWARLDPSQFARKGSRRSFAGVGAAEPSTNHDEHTVAFGAERP